MVTSLIKQWNVIVTKYPPGLFSKMLAVEDDEISQIGIPITLRHNKKIKRGYYSMLWDLILLIPLRKKLSLLE